MDVNGGIEMSTRRLFTLGLLGTAVSAATSFNAEAQAPSWSHKAYATFEREVEIPGRILSPGTYVLKLAVPEAHVGQILNSDETQILGLFFTKTADRRSTGPLETDVRLEPRQKGAVKWDRLTGWFSPGEPVGDEISYDRYKPVEPNHH